MSRIILMGESAIVKINKASGIPKARKAQPKNSATVIVIATLSVLLDNELTRRAMKKGLLTFCFLFANESLVPASIDAKSLK